jgi:hypothetical protein
VSVPPFTPNSRVVYPPLNSTELPLAWISTVSLDPIVICEENGTVQDAV